ncbi:MAG: hypothetical protein AAGE18_13410 [Pseudomonadota bacterium]
MSHENERLRRRARLAAWACRIAGPAIPALLLLSWLLGEAPAAALARLNLPADHALTATQLVLAALLSLLPALALARALFAVAECFVGFARGDWFGARQPRALSLAGQWLMVSGALAFVVPTLLGLLLSLNAGPGQRVLTIALSSNAVLAILFGALLWVLGHLWAVARGIAAENARFV